MELYFAIGFICLVVLFFVIALCRVGKKADDDMRRITEEEAERKLIQDIFNRQQEKLNSRNEGFYRKAKK